MERIIFIVDHHDEVDSLVVLMGRGFACQLLISLSTFECMTV